MMFRPSTVFAAGLLSTALLTACSDQMDNAPEQAAPSAPVTEEPEGGAQGQDGLPEGWPPEIPFPVGYEFTNDIGAAGDSPSTANIYGAIVLRVPEEEVLATLEEFESSDFTTDQEETDTVEGGNTFVNETWTVYLTVSPVDENGEFTVEETGIYSMNFIVAPADMRDQ